MGRSSLYGSNMITTYLELMRQISASLIVLSKLEIYKQPSNINAIQVEKCKYSRMSDFWKKFWDKHKLEAPFCF